MISTEFLARWRRPEDHLFQFSLRSRCTATLAGLRTLIQTGHNTKAETHCPWLTQPPPAEASPSPASGREGFTGPRMAFARITEQQGHFYGAGYCAVVRC
jgi:hypothetical protein